jgi:hypothetical protein
MDSRFPAQGAVNLLSQDGSLLFKPRDGETPKQADLLAVRAELDGGQALAPGTRGRMESAFGEDFSSLRVHTGIQATRLSDRFAGPLLDSAQAKQGHTAMAIPAVPSAQKQCRPALKQPWLNCRLPSGPRVLALEQREEEKWERLIPAQIPASPPSGGLARNTGAK